VVEKIDKLVGGLLIGVEPENVVVGGKLDGVLPLRCEIVVQMALLGN